MPMPPEERIKALMGAPPDGWVAFSEDEECLVAYGATYDELVENAAKQGVTDIVVVKVPPDWKALVLSN